MARSRVRRATGWTRRSPPGHATFACYTSDMFQTVVEAGYDHDATGGTSFVSLPLNVEEVVETGNAFAPWVLWGH